VALSSEPFPSERVKAYILNVEQALNAISAETIRDDKVKGLVLLVKSYLSDAKYYLAHNDVFTALSCIAYAEGLLDAARHLGLLSFEWKALSELLKRKRVVVAGSFEFLHPGHLFLLKKAWELGSVAVIVSRDKNFERFKNRKPLLPDTARKEILDSVKFVDEAVLGDEEDFLKPVVELKPDIILLGPDQWITPEELKEKLSQRGLSNVIVLKLEERVGDWSSSRILEILKKTACSQSQEVQ
jgi:FAD synthetase